MHEDGECFGRNTCLCEEFGWRIRRFGVREAVGRKVERLGKCSIGKVEYFDVSIAENGDAT